MPISFTVNPLDNLTFLLNPGAKGEFSGICLFVELVGIFELVRQLVMAERSFCSLVGLGASPSRTRSRQGSGY